MVQRFLTWAYGKLGRRYPYVYATIELQTAWIVILATLGLFSLYYDNPFSDFLLVAAVVCGLTAVSIGIAIARLYGYLRPLKEWIGSEDRDDPELAGPAWATAVGLPLEVIKRDLKVPVVLVALPGSIVSTFILGLSWLAFFPLFAGSLVAIGYAGILHYLALEIGMRPVLVDINRVLPPRQQTGVRSLSLRFKLLASLPLINIITGIVAAALSGTDGAPGGGTALGFDVLVAIGVAFTISLELSVMLTRSIIRPIDDLDTGMRAVREADFDHQIPVTTADELGEVTAAFNQMVDGLAERERMREAFGTYLDKQVAEYILSDGYEPEGFEVEVSVLFCDVRDFTGFASDADATEVVARLNEMFETVVPIVARHGGHVDKFIGDGLLAVFGAPERHADHAERAVRAAVEMAQTVNHDNPGPLEVGVGVNSGPVVAGSIGGAGRLNFSVIGDSVNVAARVEAATRRLGDEVLITDATRALLGGGVELEPRGPVELRGKAEPVELWAPPVRTAEHRVPSGGPALVDRPTDRGVS